MHCDNAQTRERALCLSTCRMFIADAVKHRVLLFHLIEFVFFCSQRRFLKEKVYIEEMDIHRLPLLEFKDDGRHAYRIFVGSLGRTTSREDVFELFHRFGTITGDRCKFY